MLGKVMKYDLRACGRQLLPFFGLAVAGSAVLRLLIWLAPLLWAPAAALVESLAGMLGVLLVIAVILVGCIVVMVRFYQSMVTDEGYLSFTLPVKTGAHLAGRLVVGTLYTVLAMLVAVLCATIMIPGFWRGMMDATIFSSGTGDGVSMNYALGDLPAELIWSLVGLLLVFILLAAVTNLVKVYASIAVGQRLMRSKLAGSIVAYLLINAAQGILMLFIMLIPAFAIIGGNADALEQYMFSMVVRTDPLATLSNMLGFVWGFVGIITAVSLVFAAVEYWLAWFFLDKKLNLE